MADKKISQLTGATTPLGGTEEVPLVQSSTTKKVTVANLTAGRAVAGASFQANGRIVVAGTAIYDVPGPTGNNTGIAFSGNLWLPCDGTGSLNNGVVSLGSSSYRFNELHLAGNIVLGTAGKGIDFSADASAAGMTSELLDDYEEGTWTPTTASDATGAFSAQGGKYTKVGNVVTIYGAFNVSTNFTSALVGGLPFTPSPNLAVSSVYSAVQATTNTGVVQATLNNTTDITFVAAPNTTNDVYRFSFSYIAA
jgi:hypothetical protein